MQSVDGFISVGNRISDWHDREFFDQHRGVLHHRLLLQLEADLSGHLLPASHWPLWGLPGQDVDRLCKRGQEGNGGRGSGGQGLTRTSCDVNMYHDTCIFITI